MAWAVKYSKRFQRMGTTTTYRIDILSEAGGGVVTPWKMGADPCQIKTLASERDEDKVVIGSEMTFEFVLNKRTGEADYDPLFESEYREHIVKFYNHDTSTLIWQGYLQTENMSKSIFDSNLHIYCSATDALKDLADFEFLDGDDMITGFQSGLQIIKYCLATIDTGSQFQYNFIVKLGTKHNGEGANDNALKDVTHDTRRFANIVDGACEIDDCLTVIEKVLRPYQCTLQQWGGKYYILNQHEVATNYYTYNWALVFQSKAASNDDVAIDAYSFRPGADRSYLPPIKDAKLRLLNRNLGENLVANINDYDGGDWDYANYTSAFDDSGSVMELTAEHDPIGFRVSNGYVTLDSDVNIQKLTEGDYLKLQFKFRHAEGAGATSKNFPEFTITTVRDGNEGTSPYYVFQSVWNQYESQLTTYFELWGGVGDTYAYNFKIEVFTNDDTDDYDCELYDFSFSRVVVVDEDTFADVTFDSEHHGWMNQGKVMRDREDVYFGDSYTNGDLGGLVYSGNLTDEWNREGEADAAELLWIWLKNYLISRQDYTEYIICETKDSLDNITPVNYITWDSKKYHIVSYEKSWRHSWIALHLKEWITADITVYTEITLLSSVDGKSSQSTSTYVPPPAGTNHNDLANIQGGAVGEYYHLDSADYTELHNWLDNVTLGNDGSTTLAGTTTLSSTTLVPNNGTIGQAAGPLLTFDDTNNYLEITGCKVGIGTATPAEVLDVIGNVKIDGGSYWHSAQTPGIGLRNIRPAIVLYDDNQASDNSTAIYQNADKFYIARTEYTADDWGYDEKVDVITIDSVYKTGFGTTSPNAKIESLAITEQLRLSYDSTHYTSFTVAATGSMTIAPIAGQDILISLSGTGDFIVNTNDLFVDTSTGKTGIGTATPAEDLHVYSAGACCLEVEGGTTSTATLKLTNTEGSFGWYTNDDKLVVYDYTDTANRIQIDGDGNFEHPDWVTGWFGNNWRIAENGDVEIENLLVRASARFRELIIDQLSIIAGSNLMSIARGKITSIDVLNSKVTLEDPNNRGACAFAANDFFWIKSVDIDKNLFSDCRGQITAVVGTTLTLSFAVAGANGAIGDIAEGDVIVQRGNSVDTDRQALIYTTVSDTDAPFTRVMTGVDSLAAFTDLDNVVYQSGNLDNLDSHDIVPAFPGYGVYTNNGYFTGTIVAADGEIGGWTINATSIYTGTEDHAGYTTNEGDITLYSDGANASIHMRYCYIDNTGKIYAAAGQIGGWTINTTSLYTGTEDHSGYTANAGDLTIYSDGANASIHGYYFYIDNTGKLFAKAGEIGGWTLDSDAIYTGTKYTSDGLSADGITLADDGGFHAENFYINADGEVGVNQLIYLYQGVSDDLIQSHDAEVDEDNAAYTLAKTITLGSYVKTNRTLRIRFSLKAGTNGEMVYGKIYRGAVAVGTERSTDSDAAYTEFTEDIVNWNASEDVNLYLHGDGVGIHKCYACNFRIYGSHSIVINEVTGTNTFP